MSESLSQLITAKQRSSNADKLPATPKGQFFKN